MLPYRRIILAYDRDVAGEKGSQKLQALSQRLLIAPPPAGDLCDYYRESGGKLATWIEQLALSHKVI